jgi:tRNA(Ile)-lysidine synthase
MEKEKRPWIVGVSGGPDSVFLLHRMLRWKGRLLVAHLDHGWRGEASGRDRNFVEEIAAKIGVATKSAAAPPPPKGSVKKSPSEETGRNLRRSFFGNLKKEAGADRILLGHTADDQVETVLMRILEGAGVAGLKGIPRKTAGGIERPLLDTWREDILKYLHEHKIPYRVDESNLDTRFERNWIRHVLIPLLEKRYGKELKKRIFTLGERFREIDEFLETAARRWMKRNVKATDAGPLRFQRKPFGALPAALRKRILQIACFERVGIAPNERLLESMDRVVVSGGPSVRLNIGKGAILRNRYEKVSLEIASEKTRTNAEMGSNKERHAPVVLNVEERGRIPAARLDRLMGKEQAAAFDADAVSTPFSVRPLREGDRIRPFGLDAEKKVKEILIDRKVPREERWGRPVVCDANGTILWIPGIVRSSMAPLTRSTKRTAILRVQRNRG